MGTTVSKSTTWPSASPEIKEFKVKKKLYKQTDAIVSVMAIPVVEFHVQGVSKKIFLKYEII